MKIIIEIFTVLFLTIFLTISSIHVMYAFTSSSSSSINNKVQYDIVGKWKSCVSGDEAGSFPFFKRVCDQCTTQFTNFNISGTCFKATVPSGPDIE